MKGIVTMTSGQAAILGAGIGLAGGALLGGLMWALWFGGEGLPPDTVRERVISYTAMTCPVTLLANGVLAVIIRSLLHGDTSASLIWHGVLLGSLVGVILGAVAGFAVGFLYSLLAGDGGGMWLLLALLMAVTCGVIEFILGAATGAYIGVQCKS